jgi:hypothetical protein
VVDAVPKGIVGTIAPHRLEPSRRVKSRTTCEVERPFAELYFSRNLNKHIRTRKKCFLADARMRRERDLEAYRAQRFFSTIKTSSSSRRRWAAAQRRPSEALGFCNAELSKIVNGETLTTELSQTGAYNASSTYQATLYDPSRRTVILSTDR